MPETEYRCKTCQQDLPESAYYVRKSNGKTRFGECKKCQIERAKAWKAKHPERVRQNQLSWRADIHDLFIEKFASGCIDCGCDDIYTLELDHRDPKQKKFSIGSWKVVNRERLLAEMDKCDVRCSRCHKRKTSSAMNDWRHKEMQRRLAESAPIEITEASLAA